MPLSVTSIASGSDLTLATVGSGPVVSGTATVTLGAGAAVGDLLLLFLTPMLATPPATDSQGNTYQATGSGLTYCRVTAALAAGDTITVTHGSYDNPPGVLAADTPGLRVLKISGGNIPALPNIVDYYDLHDEDAAGTTYRKATDREIASGTTMAAQNFVTDVPTDHDEITIVFVRLGGTDPGTPNMSGAHSLTPFTDTPVAPSGSFTDFGSVTGKRQLRIFGGLPWWERETCWVFAYPNIPDATTVTTDALNFGSSVYGYELEWLSLILPKPPPPNSGPWNLETLGGQYHVVYNDAGHVKYQRSDSTYPPLGTAATVSGGGYDERPRVWEQGQPPGRSRLLWRRSGAVLTAQSDDDGATWSTPVTLWASGSSPGWATGNSDPLTGIVLFAANISGGLQIRRQEPGDSSPAAAFTPTGLPAVDDATFHLFPAQDAQRRWLLVLQSSGDILSYISTDDGDTWYAA